MKIVFKKSSLKDLNSLPKKEKELISNILFDKIPIVQSINELKSLVKIKGYSNYYRIRVGNYRIGIKIEDNTLTIMRILHRKEIYKYFP